MKCEYFVATSNKRGELSDLQPLLPGTEVVFDRTILGKPVSTVTLDGDGNVQMVYTETQFTFKIQPELTGTKLPAKDRHLVDTLRERTKYLIYNPQIASDSYGTRE